MKKLMLFLFTAFLVITTDPIQLNAAPASTSSKNVANRTVESERISAEEKALIARIDEIKAMDFSKLSAAEKKELRKELKQDRNRVRNGGGIYLTVGALLIVILILVLLL